jgi:hypothetical protein
MRQVVWAFTNAVAAAQHGLFRDVEPQWVEVDLQRIAVERKRAFAVLGSG